MNPFQEWVSTETRRQFFSRGANAVGWAALASLGRHRIGSAQRRAKPKKNPLLAFAPKAKQVIYLHMVGGPPQMDLYDYKPKMKEYFDKDLPDSIRMGQRLTTMTSGPGAVSHRPVEIQIRAARQERHVGFRVACRTRPKWSTTCASSAHAHRSHQPRAGHHLHANRQPDHRPALPRRLDFLRPRLAQRKPADVRRARRQADQHRANSGHFGPALVGRLFAERTMRACRSAPPAIRSCISTIRPACRPTSAVKRSTACNSSTK